MSNPDAQPSPEALARSLFAKRNAIWPRPLFDILFEVSPLLPMRTAIEVSAHAIGERSPALRQNVREFLAMLLQLDDLLSQTAERLDEISEAAWTGKWGLFLERRGLARLFWALAQLKRGNEREYRRETIRGLAMIADNMDGDWRTEVLEYTIDSFRRVRNAPGDVSTEE